MPLSRFLIEAAREGCDLSSAEGRAHLASNAKPLWSQLPEGALKRQLLGEIAEQVQLEAQELHELWHPAARRSEGAPARRPPREGTWRKDGGTGAGPKFTPTTATRSARGRAQPISRADHATRLLLARSHLWEQISSDDHHLLCGLPEPHGPLLGWLESQLHEHGPLPWGTLHEALQGHPGEALARRLMTGSDLLPTEDHGEALAELRNVLTPLMIEHLKALETEAIAAAGHDPTALERYRALQARRRALEAGPAAAASR